MQAGISASEREGADSIVVSGGYEDDEDLGTVIIYTGAGGNDPQTKKQIADQVLRRGNLGLARSCDEGLPVRVVRGSGGDPEHSPPTGFRYDGLFRVERYWEETGRSGFKIWRFRLVKEEVDSLGDEDVSESGEPARRVESTVQRLVRNTAVTRWVKDLYDHRCQVCGVRVLTLSGPYAEGAHIKALGRPHSGPDAKSNVLCLCPTDHVRFDGGGIVVDDELNVIDQSSGEVVGPLHVHPKHQLEMEMLRYHREQFERD
jgi:putative restriction endonuclease